MFDWAGRKKEQYLKGEEIWGDDFAQSEIEQWFYDEEEGYAEILDKKRTGNETYEYEPITRRYLYKYLIEEKYENVLVYGGGFGTEIIPIVNKLENVIILEPSERFYRNEIMGKKVTYVKPEVSGTMRFPDGTFDLIICMSALHHVPNVSHIIDEFYRVCGGEGHV